MSKQLNLKITGSGTPSEIVTALSQIYNQIFTEEYVDNLNEDGDCTIEVSPLTANISAI